MRRAGPSFVRQFGIFYVLPPILYQQFIGDYLFWGAGNVMGNLSFAEFCVAYQQYYDFGDSSKLSASVTVSLHAYAHPLPQVLVLRSRLLQRDFHPLFHPLFQKGTPNQ